MDTVDTSNDSGSSSWLSGLTDFLEYAGTAAVNIYRAVDAPAPGSTLYDPRTGKPYVNQPYAPVNGLTSNSLLMFGLIFIAALFVLKQAK